MITNEILRSGAYDSLDDITHKYICTFCIRWRSVVNFLDVRLIVANKQRKMKREITFTAYPVDYCSGV